MVLERQALIGRRYRIEQLIGEGGMGEVFRAHDLLENRSVALKRLLAEPNVFNSQDTDPSISASFTLANEFRTLARLRHPNIISVLDYGFDEDRRPYYTMPIIEPAYPITQASLTDTQKLEYLQQILLALDYMHRRGILHRDLKPDNILVDDRGSAWLVDFGLAQEAELVRTSETGTLFGTFDYMAPELLSSQPASVASDLYALGVITYQLFVGKTPFAAERVYDLIRGIMFDAPDLEAVPIVLQRLVSVLLEKDPYMRPSSALDALSILRSALGLGGAVETTQVRESYLQGATFVGRKAELRRLRTAHQMMRETPSIGSAWLIGGESGVGKSRLLDEFRAHALVTGTLVLRGQSTESSQIGYQAWRAPLRRLLLTTQVSPQEIGILSEIVADCEKLTEQQGIIPTPLEVDATRYRLESTIVDIFCRQTEPTILLLDDLHWGMDGIGILHRLTQRLKDLPIMIVASYRNEESPHLPVHVPLMERIHLKRLTSEEIKELSIAMLGEGGNNPTLQDLLIRETDGNTFFVVEVVRALAESAGPLGIFANSQTLSIPHSLSIARIESVLRRRLRHVPYWGRDLLNLTAVLGRVIDVLELQTAKMQFGYIPNETLENWLTACSAVNVLDIQDNVWQFAHDKLRETLLENLTGAEHRRFNRDAARILAEAHPDHPEYLPSIVQHWRAAGDAIGELTHSILCADYMLHKRADYPQSITLIRRTLELLESLPPNNEVDYHLHHEHATLILAESYVRLNEYDQARMTLKELHPLLQMESNHMAELLVLQGIIEQHLDHDLATAEQDFLRAITIFEDNGLLHRAAEVRALDLSDLYIQGQHFHEAIGVLQAGVNQLTLDDPNNHLEEVSQRLSELLNAHQEEPVSIRSTSEIRTVQSLEDIGTPFRVALFNLNRGIQLNKEQRYAEAEPLLNQARHQFQELGHPFGIIIAYHHLVRSFLFQSKPREAQHHALNMAHMASARTEKHIQAHALLTLAYVALFHEDYLQTVSLTQTILLSDVNITSLRTQAFDVLEEARIRLVEEEYSAALQLAQRTTLLEMLFTWRWSHANSGE